MNTGTLALSGLASGVDTSSIVQQLVAVDRTRVSRMQWRQQAIQAQQTGLRDVSSKLSALLGAVKGLSTDAAYTRTQSVASSDPARVGVTVLSGAGAGGHSLRVDRLASSAQRTYGLSSDGGTLELAPQSDPTAVTKLSFAAGTKLEDVVARINAANDAPVYAAAVDGKLVLSSRTTGEHGDFTVGGSLGLQEDPDAARVGTQLNALYRLDGEDTVRSSETNVVDNAVPGLRITFKGVTTSPASVTVSLPTVDEAALSGKVKSVADAYNAFVNTITAATTEKRVVNPKSAYEASRGTLFGDTGLQSLLASVRQTLLGSDSSLAAAGLTPPKPGASVADGTSGRLTADDAAIAKALTDPSQIKRAFADLAGKLEPLVKRHTGAVNSVLDTRVTNGDRQSNDIATQVRKANERIDAEQKRLSGQFAAMEKALGASQSQQAWLEGMVNRMS